MDSLHAHVSHPILYAVRTGFVEWGKVCDVVLDFRVGEWVKCDFGFVMKSMRMDVVPKANARINGVGLIAQGIEHFGGLLGVCRFV